jgi:glycosyltransferase involved in cell wall biosynthesis
VTDGKVRQVIAMLQLKPENAHVYILPVRSAQNANFDTLAASLHWVIRMLSIVVPIYNEEPVILPLYDRLTKVLEPLDRTYEIIFVDDASTDQGFELLANLVKTDSRLKALRLRRKFGSTAAVAAGFEEAEGEVVVAFDGGPRHHPEDIPRLLRKLEEGYDIVSGWRERPAGFVNRTITRFCGGATLKVYRAEISKDVNLYGELYRFPQLMAGFYGARVGEVLVIGEAAASCGSDDRSNGAFRNFFDLLTCKFLLSYLARPVHAVGRWGAAASALGSLLFCAVLIEQWTPAASALPQQALLLFAGALLCLGGVMVFCVGLVGEILMRTYFESQGRRIYKVREVRARRERVTNGAR